MRESEKEEREREGERGREGGRERERGRWREKEIVKNMFLDFNFEKLKEQSLPLRAVIIMRVSKTDVHLSTLKTQLKREFVYDVTK